MQAESSYSPSTEGGALKDGAIDESPDSYPSWYASRPAAKSLVKQDSCILTQAGSEDSDAQTDMTVERHRTSLAVVQLCCGTVFALIFGLGLGFGFMAWGYGFGDRTSAQEPTSGVPSPSPSRDGFNSHSAPVMAPPSWPSMAPSTSPSPSLSPSTLPSTISPTMMPTRVETPPILDRKRILLQSPQTLNTNQTSSLFSHGVFLKQENDGSLVLYRNNSAGWHAMAVWSSGVSLEPGHYFTKFQGDGHIMTLRGTPEKPGSTVWKSGSGRENTGYRLVLNEKGTGVEILQSGIPPVRTWSSIDGALPWPPRTSPVILQSGPMVGHTTHRSTKIWFLAANKSSTVEVAYRRLVSLGDDAPLAAATIGYRTVVMPPREEHNGSSLAELDGLESSTTYKYQILVDSIPIAKGQFTTAPPPRQAVKFSYLLTSCMNVRAVKGYPEQYVWDTILEKKPDFAMLNGDTVYLTPGDWNSNGVIYSRVWQRNLEQREETCFAKLLSSVPIYMTWDDHDFGADNSYRNQKGKENSLAVLKAFWANPSYGTVDIPGVFYSYYWGNVQFIVMDDRWYRQKDWTQFGDRQLEWLYDQLLRSRAVFKIIVSGATITTYNDLNWIGSFVTKHKIYGVLFNAGDTHKNEFMSRNHDRWPYNVIQFTSSGIARENWMRPWALLNIDTEAIDPTITVSFYGADNKHTFTTWTHDPNMTCTDLEGSNRFNRSRCTQTVRLSDLLPEEAPAVVLESPIEGDELDAGSQETIVWRTFGPKVRSVMLQYSVDAGRSWKNITDDWIASNTGSHVWSVPRDPSVRVKVRVLASERDSTNEENNTTMVDPSIRGSQNNSSIRLNRVEKEDFAISENHGLISIRIQPNIFTG